MPSHDPKETMIAAPRTLALADRLLSRRLILGGLGAVVPSIAAGSLLANRQNTSAQATTVATPTAAMPATEASPVSTDATPVATPPVMIGQLLVVDNQRPEYLSAPVDGGDLRLLLTAGDNGNFSPASFRQDFQIMTSYLDPLIWIDEVTMDPLPWLAESWKWSQGGTRLSMKLREDVLWHDGGRFTAEDVVFSFIVYRDDIDSGVRNLFGNLESVAASDDHNLVAILSAPDGNFIRNACSQFIMQRSHFQRHWNSKEEGERTLADFNWSRSTPIGTGPWKVTKREDDEIAFERNSEYWGKVPNAETLTLTVVEDSADRLEAWKSDKADILWPLAPSDLPAVSTSPGTLYIADTATVMFAAFNFNNPNRANPALFSDINLRRALSLAIDRERYTQELFAGFANSTAAGTIAQPWANDPTVVNPARDVLAAKKLLADHGYRDIDGDGILESPTGETLRLRLIVRNTARPDFVAVLKSIVPDLAEIGVEVNVRELSPNRFDGEWIDTHNFDLIAYTYNLYPGFTDFDLYGTAWDIRTNIQGWNPGGYSNQTADQTIRTILEETNSRDNAAELRKLQRTVNDDLFALWFGFPQDLILARPGIQGFQPNKQWQTWSTANLWKETT